MAPYEPYINGALQLGLYISCVVIFCYFQQNYGSAGSPSNDLNNISTIAKIDNPTSLLKNISQETLTIEKLVENVSVSPTSSLLTNISRENSLVEKLVENVSVSPTSSLLTNISRENSLVEKLVENVSVSPTSNLLTNISRENLLVEKLVENNSPKVLSDFVENVENLHFFDASEYPPILNNLDTHQTVYKSILEFFQKFV
jgi:hypothetical protein